MNVANPAMVHSRRNARAAVLCFLMLPMFRMLAHPGHGFFEHGPRHWVSSPDHACVVLGFSLMLWVAGVTSARPVVRRWARVGCLMGFVVASALAGIRVA
jgi:hypothetical protein